jgi:hypothetical protein
MAVGCLSDPKKPFSGDVVFGDNTAEQNWDFHSCGDPEAASFTTGDTVGEIHSLWVYTGNSSGDDETGLDAAIYDSDSSGNPTMLLAVGSIEMATKLPGEQWHQMPLAQPYTPLTNHVYWIAAMCPVGKGTGFSPVYKYLGQEGPGTCDATKNPCTQHGGLNETTFDPTWTMTYSYLPSTNSFYASPN